MIILVLMALATSVCGNDGMDLSDSMPSAPTQPAPTTISPLAQNYLDALLVIAQKYVVNTGEIDWATVRTHVFESAGAAQTIRDTYPAIRVALQMLDNESYYMGAGGRIGGATGPCRTSTAPVPVVPDTIAYVKVSPCPCDGDAAKTQYAESVQQIIRRADRTGLDGWIIDFRGNFGGNMWPMIAGLGPLLGEGIIGWIVYNDREYEREYRDGAALSLGEIFASVREPYTLINASPRVAVITDDTVVSAGEAVVTFFKGRANIRSFGTATCGQHHLQQSFPLSDGATIVLRTAIHTDHTKRKWGGPIPPDEMITDSNQQVERAITWLREGK